MGYPGGDPGWERGACSDLVIRAFRHAGVDLQLLVSEDIARDRTAYRIERADVRIDHRRVRNLHIFFERRGTRVTSQASPGPPAAYHGRRRGPDWRPGDIVIWDLFGGTSPNHIGIVSDRNGPSGLPLVIHHYREKDGFTGRPSEDDCLARWRILGHFRWLGEVGRRVPD